MRVPIKSAVLEKSHMVRPICAWCNKKIDMRSEAVVLGLRLRPELQGMRKRDEGKIINVEISALGRNVMALIPAAKSEARRAGDDIQFPVCRLSCAKALEAAIVDEGILVQNIE